jgi:hypothetical protein
MNNQNLYLKIISTLILVSIIFFILIYLDVQTDKTIFSFPTLKGRYEYMVKDVHDENLNNTLDSLGNKGWELIFARRASEEISGANTQLPIYEMIFKRKK